MGRFNFSDGSNTIARITDASRSGEALLQMYKKNYEITFKTLWIYIVPLKLLLSIPYASL